MLKRYGSLKESFEYFLKLLGDFSLVIVISLLFINSITISQAQALTTDNQIILPFDGQVEVNFISTNASCTGDFGLIRPVEIVVFPDYLFTSGISFPIAEFFDCGTELVFYITPIGICSGETYLSTDLNRAHITHPDESTWLISWEDYTDGDFNDLVVEIKLNKLNKPFLDLPFDYGDSNFLTRVQDDELEGGRIGSYFDHEYPTYWEQPSNSCVTCLPGDLDAVNFNGYWGLSTNPPPPYKVQYNGHNGIDFTLEGGTKVLTAAPGMVTVIDSNSFAGNYVEVTHSNGFKTEYWHLDEIFVEQGETIERDVNEPIGTVGTTGSSTGFHLHFQVLNPSGVVVDPFGWDPLPTSSFFGMDDPWKQWNADNGGLDATSDYLWYCKLTNSSVTSDTSTTTITTPSEKAFATFPIFSSPLLIKMTEGLFSPELKDLSVLYSFSLFTFDTNSIPVTSLSSPVKIGVYLDTPEINIFSTTAQIDYQLHLFDPLSGNWVLLPAEWDDMNSCLTIETSTVGNFLIAIPEYETFLPLIGKN